MNQPHYQENSLASVGRFLGSVTFGRGTSQEGMMDIDVARKRHDAKLLDEWNGDEARFSRTKRKVDPDYEYERMRDEEERQASE